MDPYTMQTSFSEVRSSMTLPREEPTAKRQQARRFSAEPSSSPSVMFTSTASIQLSQASRVGRTAGGRAGSTGGPPMMTSGEYFFDEEFSVPFDANLIVGTPLDEDSLGMAGSRRSVSNLRMTNSRSDGCLFYPEDDLEEELRKAKMNGRMEADAEARQMMSGTSVTSGESDMLTGVSNIEEQTSWASGTQALLQSALLRRVPEYKLVYETSASGGGLASCDSSPRLPRSRKSPSFSSPHRQLQQQQLERAQQQRQHRPSQRPHSTWADLAARRTDGGLMKWTSSQELSTHVSDEAVGESPSPSGKKLTTWGRIHSASRERLNLSPEGSGGGSGGDEAVLRTGAQKGPTKTTWRQLRQQRNRLGPSESSGSSSDLLMARSRSMEALNKISRGVTAATPDAGDTSSLPRRVATWYSPSPTADQGIDASVEEDAARYLRHQRVLGFTEFQQRTRQVSASSSGRGPPSVMDSRSRLRRNSSAAAALTANREARRKYRNNSGGSSVAASSASAASPGLIARRHHQRASSQPATQKKQLMVGLSANDLPDLSFLSSHLTRLKERAATEGERLRRTQSCQVLTATETSHSSPPASCDSGFDSNEQSTLLCKRCGSLTNVDREETPRGSRRSRAAASRAPTLSQGLPSRHRSEPDLAQLYVHTDDIPIEQAGGGAPSALPGPGTPSSGRTTPLKSCLVSRSKSPQAGGTPTGSEPPSGHAHRGSLDFTPGRAASPASGSAPGTRGSSPVSGGHGGELKKSVSFSRAVRVQQAVTSGQAARGRPRQREQTPPSDLKLIPTAVGLYGTESDSTGSYPVLMPTSPDASPSDDSQNGSVSSNAGLDISQKRYKALVDDVMRSANAAVLSFSPNSTTPTAPGPSPRPNPLAMVAPLTTLVTDGLMPPGSQAGGVDSPSMRLARAKTRLWPMVEESCRQGISHRVLSDVLREVKNLSGITTDRAKFRAFLCSCLNNKALSLWLDSLVRNETLLRRFYYDDAFLRLASLHSSPNLSKSPSPSPATATVVRKLFHASLMSSLEKLLTLPYRLDIGVEAKRSSASEWLPSTTASATATSMTPPKSPSRQPIRARHDINTTPTTPTVRRVNSGRAAVGGPTRGSLVERGRGRNVVGVERRATTAGTTARGGKTATTARRTS